MNKLISLLFFMTLFEASQPDEKQFIARQGQVSFFSYTSVENIEAKNNQVLSLLDLEKNEIAISMLMRAFVFKKDLMYEHFNDSYIESDIFPKAEFTGRIIDFEPQNNNQTKIISGVLKIHGISKNIDIKTNIKKRDAGYSLSGNFEVLVKDFDIKIPPILSGNIAKNIKVTFNFNYETYEE